MTSRGGWKLGKEPDVGKLLRKIVDKTIARKRRALGGYRCPEHGMPLEDFEVIEEEGRVTGFRCNPCCDVARQGAQETFNQA